MSTQHTLGPWAVGQCTWNEDGNVCYELRDIKHGSASDARLISAAPDMLHALRRAVIALAGTSDRDMLHEEYEIVSAAIAKATGERNE